MRKSLVCVFAATGLLASAAVAVADGHLAKPIKARQSVMQLYSFNLGQIGAMVKGEMEYNEELAKASANNLVTATSLNQMAMWPQGSSIDDLGKDVTVAKANIWADGSDVGEKGKALKDAAAKMAEAANGGGGLEALKAAIGDVGAACKGCHEKYRAPKD